jgi:hypothetical protein
MDMNEVEPSSDSPETLHEFMDEKVKIQGGINPSREHELGVLLQNLPGVKSISVAGDEVAITYEPTQITSQEMHERMKGAGFVPEETAVGPSAPSVAH